MPDILPFGEFLWGHSDWGGDGLLPPIYNRKTGTYYNASDLNRVEHNTEYIEDSLNASGSNLSLTEKTNWEMENIPKQTDMERYRGNVAAVRDELAVPASVPAVPESMQFLGFQSANDIEKIQMDVSARIGNMRRTIDAAWASGLAYTGLYFMGV